MQCAGPRATACRRRPSCPPTAGGTRSHGWPSSGKVATSRQARPARRRGRSCCPTTCSACSAGTRRRRRRRCPRRAPGRLPTHHASPVARMTADARLRLRPYRTSTSSTSTAMAALESSRATCDTACCWLVRAGGRLRDAPRDSRTPSPPRALLRLRSRRRWPSRSPRRRPWPFSPVRSQRGLGRVAARNTGSAQPASRPAPRHSAQHRRVATGRRTWSPRTSMLTARPTSPSPRSAGARSDGFRSCENRTERYDHPSFTESRDRPPPGGRSRHPGRSR